MAATLTKEQIEAIINRTFPGLALLYRDTELPQACLKNYEVGSIIKERGFTDCSPNQGGMVKPHRYLIASAHSRMVPGSAQNLCVIAPGSYFKVMDKYTQADKTQIVLLHCPDKEAADFFDQVQTGMDEQIISAARASFERNLTAQPYGPHNNTEWHRRTNEPLGMDDKGKLFPLDPEFLEKE